jgi:hypothetical protein
LPKKVAPLAGRELVAAVTEFVEDGFAKIVRHHQDRNVEDGKSSEITIKISIKPNNTNRTRFATSAKHSVKLAEPNTGSYEGRLFVKLDDNGDVEEASDMDPNQLRMNLDDRESVRR